jgi:hypothetical protein
MNITYNPANEAERALVAQVNRLLEEAEAEIPTRSYAPGSDDVDVIGKGAEGLTVTKFRENVGRGWEFVRLAAQHFNADEEFGFKELSSRSGESVERLKAYHRNLARTAKYLGGHITDIIPTRWDGSWGVYRIPPELHAEASK